MPGASVTSGMFAAAASMTTVVHVVRHSAAQWRDQRGETDIDEQDLVLRVVDDVGDVVRVQPRIDGVADRLHPGRGIVHLQMTVAVPGQGADPVPRPTPAPAAPGPGGGRALPRPPRCSGAWCSRGCGTPPRPIRDAARHGSGSRKSSVLGTASDRARRHLRVGACRALRRRGMIREASAKRRGNAR